MGNETLHLSLKREWTMVPDASMSNVRMNLMKPRLLARWISRLGVAALVMAGAASAADVVILDGGAADELGRRGLLRSDSKVELARSLIGMVVQAGAAKPDIGSVEAFRSTLLAAKSIAYSDSGSGTYISATLFAKLGVVDQVAGKSRKVRGPPSGEPVAAVVARGEAEIGFQQVSELVRVPGITFVGTIGRAPAWVFLCGGTYQHDPAARGKQCVDPVPRLARSGRGDLEGRADADFKTLAPRPGISHAPIEIELVARSGRFLVPLQTAPSSPRLARWSPSMLVLD